MTRAAKSDVGKRKSDAGKYRHPRTGEKRQRRSHLQIDRLPKEVKDAIISARSTGQSWKETANAASLKAGHCIPTTTVQRWYDLRVEQPAREAATNGASLSEIIRLLKSILSAVNA
jgi:hypothetical protein